jgi:hypothetical protein
MGCCGSKPEVKEDDKPEERPQENNDVSVKTHWPIHPPTHATRPQQPGVVNLCTCMRKALREFESACVFIAPMCRWPSMCTTAPLHSPPRAAINLISSRMSSTHTPAAPGRREERTLRLLHRGTCEGTPTHQTSINQHQHAKNSNKRGPPRSCTPRDVHHYRTCALSCTHSLARICSRTCTNLRVSCIRKHKHPLCTL